MDTTQAQPAPLVLAHFLPYRIVVLAERLSRAFAGRYGAAFGLSIAEWRVMAVLGERAPRSTREVIACTAMDRVKVSRAVIRLAERGFIARRAHPADQRARMLRLSRRGEAVYRQVVPLAHSLQAELAAVLTQDEARALDGILGKLHEAAAALAGTSQGGP